MTDLAHHFFSRCLEGNVVPYVVTKKTVFKWQEGFWTIMKSVFDEHYKYAPHTSYLLLLLLSLLLISFLPYHTSSCHSILYYAYLELSSVLQLHYLTSSIHAIQTMYNALFYSLLLFSSLLFPFPLFSSLLFFYSYHTL